MKRVALGFAAAMAVAGCSQVARPSASAHAPMAPASPASPASPAAHPDAHNTALAVLAQDYVDQLTRLDPVTATMLGDHDQDGDLPDVSAHGRDTELYHARLMQDRLAQIDRSQLTTDGKIDAALLDNALRQQIWQVETLQEWAWNPQYYNDIASYSLYSLVARDFAPWPRRMASAIERMEKLPAFFEQARQQLDPARVPRVHAEMVARQHAGIMEIVDAALVPEIERSDTPARSRFDRALANLEMALDTHQRWLDEELVPNAAGDFRLGAELYDTKMRFELMSPLARGELQARAVKAKAETRSQMLALSRSILADAGIDLDVPSDPAEAQQLTIEAALKLSYAQRPAREELEQSARETLAQATEFTREQGLVTMPQGAVQVITMPTFWQGNAVAYDDPPGALERHLPNYYAVSPIPDDWSDEQATSFLSEYNTFMLHDLSIHEGVPGHYLQLDHANRHESQLRAVLQSGPFIEGWAVYSEGVMADAGYLGDDPMAAQLFKLTVLKMRLRSVTNTLLDIGIHTQGMTREEAMDLMMKGAFQQESEAAGKWTRANLSSVQLLSYFTGYTEHMDLRAEAQRRQGNNFTLRAYHDEVLSHGSPPVKYIRALMFDEAVE